MQHICLAVCVATSTDQVAPVLEEQDKDDCHHHHQHQDHRHVAQCYQEYDARIVTGALVEGSIDSATTNNRACII